MALTFIYRARTRAGERVAGTMRVLDRASALNILRERRLIPSELRIADTAFSLFRVLYRSPARERLAFFRAYAALEAAGVDFSTAFGLLIDQARTPRFKEALRFVRSEVEGLGEKLWAAMSHRPDDFSDLEVAMVAAGEEAGNRAETFDRLAAFLERDERFHKQMSAALMYPAIVVCVASVVTAYLVFGVVPQFIALFRSFNVATTPFMDFLAGFGALCARPPVVMLAAAVAAMSVGGLLFAAGTPSGAAALDRMRLAVPLLGNLLRKAAITRISRVLSTLLESGVNQLRALEVSVPVAESPVFSQALDVARQQIGSGACATLEEALSLTGIFEPLALGFVRIGAQTGNVPAMLAKVAEYYEDDVAALVTQIPTLVQTLVTLGLGFVVGLIVYAVYVPLTTLASSVR